MSTKMGLLVMLSALFAACAGSSASRGPAEEETVQRYDCVPERWEEPPPNIGETPPVDAAPHDSLRPFYDPDQED